ncbi:MAG: ABC-2 transporter permease [bacterium]|nr:ABC-2 transporter permease [bacterium]
MNKIKSLLIKDFLELKSYKKNFIFSLFIYIGLIVLNADNGDMITMGTSMIIFLFSIYSIATFNYDEKSKADKYILCMPVTKREVVLSKYILIFTSMVLGVITSLFLGVILYFIGIVKISNFNNYFPSLLVLLFTLSIVYGIQIPCIYKYGAEKGRLQIYLILMFIFLIIGIIYILFPNINLEFLNPFEKVIPYILIALIILNYYISYKISYNIYLKKEV